MSEGFWEELGRRLKPDKPEAFWAAQRSRVLARLRTGTSRPLPAYRRWLPVPALAGAALALVLIVGRRGGGPPEGAWVPAQDWEFLESMELLEDLDVLLEASQLDRL